jgi:uncharacterized protein YcnI
MKGKRFLILAGAIGLAVSVTPLAFGHATVSPDNPQGAALTGARTTYVLRVPNERADRATTRVTMTVPEDVRTAISVLAMPGWTIRLARVDTGGRTAEGAPILATTRITWIPKQGNQMMPGFYSEFFFRFQNPLTPTRLCFPTLQQYGGKLNAKGKAKGPGELVSWTGPAESATPASCVAIVANR